MKNNCYSTMKEGESVIQLSSKQMKAIKKLVVYECVNYIQGQCILLDKDCPQLKNRNKLCSYFKESILPMDEYLYLEITKEGFFKRCEVCNTLFTSKARNTIYCTECAKKQTRKNKKRYMQNIRKK